MKVSEAIRDATRRLEETSDTARLDAELLMAHALGVSRSDLLIRMMDEPVPSQFYRLVGRRSKHEPVAYITGWTEFYGRRFDVEPGVLIPRGDSEILIDVALEVHPHAKRILDLGVGSGALLFTLLEELPKASGVGIDASQDAIEVALGNGVGFESERDIFDEQDWRLHRCSWQTPDWADNLGNFDLIVCNPPYIESTAELDLDVRDFEPASALFAGPDGLDDYRILIPQLRPLMNENARALFEIGHTQADAVTKIAHDAGFQVELRHDLANRPRVLILS